MTNKKLWTVLGVLAVFTLGRAEPVSDQVNLADWARVGDVTWDVNGNSVTVEAEGSSGFLVSPDNWGDFRLSLDYQIRDDTNSGIFVRCISAEKPSPDICYEINIWDSHPDQSKRTGAIVGITSAAAHIDGLNRWVTVEIVAQRDRIRAYFDGKLTADIRDSRSLSGRIALQYGGKDKLEFRKLAIHTLQ